MNHEDSLITRALGKTHGKDAVTFQFDCTTLSNNDKLEYSGSGFHVELRHVDGDPPQVHRIYFRNRRMEVELLPSKGLSIGEAFHFGTGESSPRGESAGAREKTGTPIFWKPPLAHLPDPREFSASDAILVDGKRIEGLAYIGAMYGGIELLGLYNWGMPQTTESGEFLPLHGDVANIPVDTVQCTFSEVGCEIVGEFLSRDHLGREPLCRVRKCLVLEPDSTRIFAIDTLKNITEQSISPDWGYHVNLRPKHGAEYLVPSREVQIRGRGGDMEKHRVWHAAAVESEREEYGLIRKGLRIEDDVLMGDRGTRSVVRYPDGSGTMIVTPPAPYFQSWYSSGGVNGTCFMLPDKANREEAIFLENGWNGMGAEYGASALDHNGNVDSTIEARELAPGESIDLKLIIQVLDPAEVKELAAEIERYNEGQETL